MYSDLHNGHVGLSLMLHQTSGLPQPVLEQIQLPPRIEAVQSVLSEKLRNFGIPVDAEWNRNSAKGIANLADELLSGEAELLAAGRTLVRQVRVVRVDVLHVLDDGRVLKLVEDHQTFSDGRERRRSQDFAVWEKMSPKDREDPLVAARRGLREELKIASPDDKFIINRAGMPKDLRIASSPLRFENQRTQTIIEPPGDYPRIPSIAEQTDYRIILPSDVFDAGGYQEVQPDKVTVFLWRNAPEIKIPRPNLDSFTLA